MPFKIAGNKHLIQPMPPQTCSGVELDTLKKKVESVAANSPSVAPNTDNQRQQPQPKQPSQVKRVITPRTTPSDPFFFCIGGINHFKPYY